MDDISNSSSGGLYSPGHQGFAARETFYDLLGGLSAAGAAHYSPGASDSALVERSVELEAIKQNALDTLPPLYPNEDPDIEYGLHHQSSDLDYGAPSYSSAGVEFDQGSSNPLSLLSDVALGNESSLPEASDLTTISPISFEPSTNMSGNSNDSSTNQGYINRKICPARNSEINGTVANVNNESSSSSGRNRHINDSDDVVLSRKKRVRNTNAKGRKSQRSLEVKNSYWLPPRETIDDSTSDVSDVEISFSHARPIHHRRCSTVSINDGPTAPDLQLDWVTTTDSESDSDSCVEVLCVPNENSNRSVDLVDLTHESEDEYSLPGQGDGRNNEDSSNIEVNNRNISNTVASSISLRSVAEDNSIDSMGNVNSAGPSSCSLSGLAGTNHAQTSLQDSSSTSAASLTSSNSASTCSCSRGPLIGSVGLSANGTAGYNVDLAACYGATCLGPQYSSNHQQHTVNSNGHHHHHHHYYAGVTPQHFYPPAGLPTTNNPFSHQFPNASSSLNNSVSDVVGGYSCARHLASRLHPTHHRMWLSQQRAQEIQRRQMDPHAHHHHYHHHHTPHLRDTSSSAAHHHYFPPYMNPHSHSSEGIQQPHHFRIAPPYGDVSSTAGSNSSTSSSSVHPTSAPVNNGLTDPLSSISGFSRIPGHHPNSSSESSGNSVSSGAAAVSVSASAAYSNQQPSTSTSNNLVINETYNNSVSSHHPMGSSTGHSHPPR